VLTLLLYLRKNIFKSFEEWERGDSSFEMRKIAGRKKKSTSPNPLLGSRGVPSKLAGLRA
jgi:hypothetical protein